MAPDDVKEKPDDDASHRHKRNVANPGHCQIVGVVEPIILRQHQRDDSRCQQSVHPIACLRKGSVVTNADDFEEEKVEDGHRDGADEVSDADSSQNGIIHANHLGIDSGKEVKGISTSQEEAHDGKVGILLDSTSGPHGVSDEEDQGQVDEVEGALGDISRFHSVKRKVNAAAASTGILIEVPQSNFFKFFPKKQAKAH